MPRTVRWTAALAVLLLSAYAAGDDSISETINARCVRYEDGLQGPYNGIKGGLESWLRNQRQEALDQLHGLMASQSGEARLFVAFHCLGMDPGDSAARAAFDDAKAAVPIDAHGESTAPFTLTGPVPADLAQRVAELEHPGFEVVAQAVDLHSSLVQSYFGAQDQALHSLLADLLELKKQGEPLLVFQMLAYYYPNCKEVVNHYHASGRPVPTTRWWVDHVDQFLIDNELMGRDCLLFKPSSGTKPHRNADGTYAVSPATWKFLEVRSARVEGVVSAAKGILPPFELGEESEQGGIKVVFLPKNQVQLSELPSHKVLGTGTALCDLSKPTPIALELRDRVAQVSLGGLPVVTARTSHPCALRRFSLESSSITARFLRVRFIADHAITGLIQQAAPKPTPPESPQLVAALAKTVSVSFDATPVEDAIAVIARQAGIKIVLDESGLLLKDVPLTLDAKNMTLQGMLDNIHRQTDLVAKAADNQITLSWSK